MPRYCRAAKWKMDNAKERIKGTIDWRREYKPDLIKPDDVKIVSMMMVLAANESLFLMPFHCDRKRRRERCEFRAVLKTSLFFRAHPDDRL